MFQNCQAPLDTQNMLSKHICVFTDTDLVYYIIKIELGVTYKQMLLRNGF